MSGKQCKKLFSKKHCFVWYEALRAYNSRQLLTIVCMESQHPQNETRTQHPIQHLFSRPAFGHQARLLYLDISENIRISEFIPLLPIGCWGGPRAQRGPGDPFYNHPGHWGRELLYWGISENIHISEFILLLPIGCWGGPRAEGPKGAHGDPFF